MDFTDAFGIMPGAFLCGIIREVFNISCTYLVPNSPCAKKKDLTILAKSLIFLVGVGGFEPPTN
jgi:hypothetical protein